MFSFIQLQDVIAKKFVQSGHFTVRSSHRDFDFESKEVLVACRSWCKRPARKCNFLLCVTEVVNGISLKSKNRTS